MSKLGNQRISDVSDRIWSESASDFYWLTSWLLPTTREIMGGCSPTESFYLRYLKSVMNVLKRRSFERYIQTQMAFPDIIFNPAHLRTDRWIFMAVSGSLAWWFRVTHEADEYTCYSSLLRTDSVVWDYFELCCSALKTLTICLWFLLLCVTLETLSTRDTFLFHQYPPCWPCSISFHICTWI